MRSQTPSLQRRPETSTDDYTPADQTPADHEPADERISRHELRQVLAALRTAVDLELDRLTKKPNTTVLDLDGLMRLEGLLSIYDDFATQWRPSDILRSLHADLESHNTDVRQHTATPALGAFLKPRPTTESSVPDRHRIDPPTHGLGLV